MRKKEAAREIGGQKPFRRPSGLTPAAEAYRLHRHRRYRKKGAGPQRRPAGSLTGYTKLESRRADIELLLRYAEKPLARLAAKPDACARSPSEARPTPFAVRERYRSERRVSLSGGLPPVPLKTGAQIEPLPLALPRARVSPGIMGLGTETRGKKPVRASAAG